MNVVKSLLVLVGLLLLAGCDSTAQPPASLAGGGFIFNYRLGEVYYGAVVKTSRDLPQGSTIVAEFENPSGGSPLTFSQAADNNLRQYVFRTSALQGVKKDVPYHVVIRILDGPNGKELQRIEHAYKSDFDGSILAGGPLVIGPGYTPNPANDITKPAAN